jgi:hypothetical protein
MTCLSSSRLSRSSMASTRTLRGRYRTPWPKAPQGSFAHQIKNADALRLIARRQFKLPLMT